MRNGNGRCTTASSIRRVTRARTISRSTSRRARYSPKWSSIERSRPLTRWKWRLETALLPPGRTATACPTRVSFHARMALQANVNMFDSWRRRRILLVWSRPLSIAKRLANQHDPINAILTSRFSRITRKANRFRRLISSFRLVGACLIRILIRYIRSSAGKIKRSTRAPQLYLMVEHQSFRQIIRRIKSRFYFGWYSASCWTFMSTLARLPPSATVANSLMMDALCRSYNRRPYKKAGQKAVRSVRSQRTVLWVGSVCLYWPALAW